MRFSPRHWRRLRGHAPVPVVLLALSVGVTSVTGAAGAAGASAPTVGAWPLSPRPAVIAPFREPTHRYGPGHRGADLMGATGQVVLSTLGGHVRFAGSVAGVPLISVDHGDGRRTTYQPVASTLVSGAPVAKGTPLGVLVPIGSHCAPLLCLHWGLYDEGHALHRDPLTLVQRQRVRLLPVVE